MFGAYKEDYLINGEKFTASANFISETLYIFSRGLSKRHSLDEYTNFEGNMEDFIKHHYAV